MKISTGRIVPKTAVLFLGVLLTAATVHAELKRVVQNEPGALEIQVFATDDLGFVEEWKTTPPEHGPTIHRVSTAKFNEMFHVGFIVTGSAQDPEGYHSFAVDVKVTAPDGQILVDEKGWAVHHVQMDSDRGLILVDQMMDVVIESGDPAGKYLFEATVHDKVSDKSSIGMYEVVVAE